MNNKKIKTINKMYRLAKAVREAYSELYASRNEAELQPFAKTLEECTRKLVETEWDLYQIGNGLY